VKSSWCGSLRLYTEREVEEEDVESFSIQKGEGNRAKGRDLI
jgi:hypothetical protein